MSWNKPVESAGKSSSRDVSSRNISSSWLIVGSVVVIAALVSVYVYLRQANTNAESEVPRSSGMIAEVKPSVPAKSKVEVVEEPKVIPYWERDTTNGLTRRQLMKWRIHHMPPAAYTNNSSQTEAKPDYAIFDTYVDNVIASTICTVPGEAVIGDPGYDRWFTAAFLKSLETPIIVTKDDTPEQAQLKKDVIATKLELKDRYDAGEDLAEIMNQTMEDYREMARYKTEIEDSFNELVKDKTDLTEQDVDDFLSAANKMLDAKGIANLKLSPMAKRSLVRRALKMKGNK